MITRLNKPVALDYPCHVRPGDSFRFTCRLTTEGGRNHDFKRLLPITRMQTITHVRIRGWIILGYFAVITKLTLLDEATDRV